MCLSHDGKKMFCGIPFVGDRYDSEPKWSRSRRRSQEFNDELDDRSWKDRFSSKKKDDDDDSEESSPEFM